MGGMCRYHWVRVHKYSYPDSYFILYTNVETPGGFVRSHLLGIQAKIQDFLKVCIGILYGVNKGPLKGVV